MNLLLAHIDGHAHLHGGDVTIILIPAVIVACWIVANLGNLIRKGK